ncbi:uncharacterized protein [Watersipora subatra]|uniref:uncharacterized protein isoform X2 n=1 Tax=Watersipora subatra TaxID=2589382 RepID=UPI00355BF773
MYNDWVSATPLTYGAEATRSITAQPVEYVGITKKHWVQKSSRSVCKTRSCRSKFSLINAPKNCYKCGEVFCKLCLCQSRKLNVLARYDPQGRFYKVCVQCFDSEGQCMGSTRGLMGLFRASRSAACKIGGGSTRPEWMAAEERVLTGFLNEINSTPNLVRRVQSLTVNLVKGVWRKPVQAQEGGKCCSGCSKQFEVIFRMRHQCTLCGTAVCDRCSNRDLIVYIPDEVSCRIDGLYSHAKLSLLYIQGSPGKEPKIHEYLRICGDCHKAKGARQVKDIVDSKKGQDHAAFWDCLLPFHREMLHDQRMIESSLEKYEISVRSLEDGSDKNKFGSSVQVLSKSQIDLSDLFYNYCKHVSRVKSFKPITGKTEILVRAIQLALLCVHLLIKQLGLEILSIADGHGLSRALQIAQFLADAEEVIGEELKVVLLKLEEGITWEDHMKDVNVMLRQSLLEHQLITLTDHQLSNQDYLMNELIERSCVLLEQITLQLMVKTTDNSFRLVKERVVKVKSQILELVCV